jgi:transcriptional regulator with XRE-family HTH domain
MNRINIEIKEKGVKQTWLAEKLGKSFNIVNDYCNNRRQPSLELLYKIADILNIKPKDLLKD